MSRSDQTTEPGPDLGIATDKVCFIVVKAREFDAKDLVTEPDPASNPTDDGMIAVLEDHEDDPVVRELAGFIGALSEDEQIDLVALIAAVLGFGGIAGFAVEIAKIIFFVAILLFAISAVVALMRGRTPTMP